MSLSVCIDALYYGRNTPLRTQVEETARAGLDTIEFWTWWDKDMDDLRTQCDRHHVRVSCFCTKFVSLLDPARRGQYMAGLRESCEAAKKIGVKKLISQVGNLIEGVSRESQMAELVRGLTEAADIVHAHGITLLVEPLNTRVDHQGYFLVSSDDAVRMCAAVSRAEIKLLFDVYHQQISEGDILRRIDAASGSIGHFHIAANPGRGRPGTGELNCRHVIDTIESRFPGVDIGLEYFTKEEVPRSLQTLKEYLGR